MVSVLFENPKAPGNVETMCRTANFYGVDYYISKKPQVRLSNQKSAGAIKNKPPKLLDLKDWKGRIIVTDSTFQVEPQDFEFRDSDLIVFGHENLGVSDKAKMLSYARIGIRQRGAGCPCLNVAAACAAVLGIVFSKRDDAK